jgi:hypothetical protein
MVQANRAKISTSRGGIRMITAEFQPKLFNQAPVTVTEDPYVFLEMWVKDPTNIYRSQCKYWTRSSSQVFQRYIYGADIVGLHGGRSLTSATLTRTININESGTYWVLVRSFRCPEQGAKNISLSIDGKSLGNIDSYSPWYNYRFLDFGHIELTSGNHSFVIGLNGKDAWVDFLVLYKLDYYSSEETESRYRLDWDEIEFTENAMGELNTADITVALKEEWNDPNRNIYSRKVFDYSDMVNIIVGSPDDYSNARVKFGGYLIGWDESDEGDKITFNCLDSLLSLYDRPTYTNYYVGVPVAGDQNTHQSLQFGSSLEAIRHALETNEIAPMTFGIEYPYAMYRDFRNIEDFNKVDVTGFTKAYSPTFGMRLGYGKSTGTCSAGLFNSSDSVLFDAAQDEIMAFQYMASGLGCGPNTRMQFTIQVSMYKDGESPSDAQWYDILFTGKSGAKTRKYIGSIQPVLNGKPQIAKFNLKQAFDRYAPSSHYYINKIQLYDSATASQISNRDHSVMQIISLMAYNKDINHKFKVNQDTGYVYENITEMLENMNYVAWVDYGRRRSLDVFCMAPEMNETSPVTGEEGVNVLAVTDKSYAPRDNLRNRRLSHYHYEIGDNEQTGLSYVENLDSVLRYGPGAKEEYEDMTEVNNITDANIENERVIELNSYPMQSFTIVMKGTPLLNPSQYMVSKLQSDYLVGNYSTKTATHSITKDEGYITRISVNRPGSYYNMIMNKLERRIKETRNIRTGAMYSQNVLTNMGFSSLGAFIRSGW